MAKGQKRSNRELRKPSQDKAAPEFDKNLFANQVKLATNLRDASRRSERIRLNAPPLNADEIDAAPWP